MRLIGHELILFYSLGIFLVIGTHDKVCSSIIKFSTIVFWAAFTMCILTHDIQITSDIDSWNNILDNQGRYTESLAYMFFRPFTFLGLPLFIYGWLEKTRRWHYLHILSLPAYFLINVMMFKFRGALILSSLVAMAAILMHTSITRKLKLLFLAIVLIIFALGWINTKGGVQFSERMERFKNTDSIIKYRLPEVERYFKVMGYEWLWGRGLGGTYKYNNTDWGRNRGGLHIGWLTFTLKGGIPLLIIMLTFFGAWLRMKKRWLKSDPYYKVAWFWTPISFVDILVNPILLHVSLVLVYGLTFLLIGRFGKRSVVTEKLLSATEATHIRPQSIAERESSILLS